MEQITEKQEQATTQNAQKISRYPRNLESMFLIFGNPGEVYYTKKQPVNVHMLARGYNRKIVIEQCIVIPTAKSAKEYDQVYKVTILE